MTRAQTGAAIEHSGAGRRGKTTQPDPGSDGVDRLNSGLFRQDRPARVMHHGRSMKTVAALSLFSLVPAVAFTLASPNASAQQLQPPIPPPRVLQEPPLAQGPDGGQPEDPAR